MDAFVPLPKNIQILNDRDAIIIRRKWFTPAAFFFAFFSVFWNGFMVVWMSIAIREGQWPMAAFGSIHGSIGIGLAYFTVASFINKTDISIDPNYLSVRHYPLPWGRSKKFKTHTIQQIYTQEKIRNSKNGTSVSYPLFLITNDNHEEKLLSGISEISQAKFIENEIEKVLGIKNIKVVGEYGA